MCRKRYRTETDKISHHRDKYKLLPPCGEKCKQKCPSPSVMKIDSKSTTTIEDYRFAKDEYGSINTLTLSISNVEGQASIVMKENTVLFTLCQIVPPKTNEFARLCFCQPLDFAPMALLHSLCVLRLNQKRL